MDDGADTPAESLAMLDAAYDEGIRTIFATPHYGPENIYTPDYTLVERRFGELRAAAAERHPDMRLFPGAELFCNPIDVIRRVEQKEAHPMAGSRYLLMEFAEWSGMSESAEYICESLLRIRAAAGGKWLPILAHAERYRDFKGKEVLYRKLAEGGVYLQVNAYDLSDSQMNDGTRERARRLVGERLAHFLGTDAQSGRNPGGGKKSRPPFMRRGVEYLYANCGDAYADALVFGNAERLIQDKYVEPIWKGR